LSGILLKPFENWTGNEMAIRFPVQFGPFISYETDQLKTKPFEYLNQRVSGSPNEPDFRFLY
jgi:hypothetical protein